MNKYFRGLRVYIPLGTPDVAAKLRGSTIRITKRLTERSRIHSVLGRRDLTWEGEVIMAQDRSTIGHPVYINEYAGHPLSYDGAAPSPDSLETILRQCHADPQKILGGL